MKERAEAQGNLSVTPYDNVSQLVGLLRSRTTNPQIENLVSWIPSADEYDRISHSGVEKLARFTTDALGHYAAFADATRYLHIYRPQDGPTAADNLGLTRSQSAELLPLLSEVTFGMIGYIESIIDDHLASDLPLIASRLDTAGQALGFNMLVLYRARNKGEEKSSDINLEFDNGLKFNDIRAKILLADVLPRDTYISRARYDQQMNSLTLNVPVKILEVQE